MSRSTLTVLGGALIVAALVYHMQQAAAPPPSSPDAKQPDKTVPKKPKAPPKRPRGPCGPGPCPMQRLNAASSAALSPIVFAACANPDCTCADCRCGPNCACPYARGDGDSAKRPRRPRRPRQADEPVLGGVDSPDGSVHILFLPPELDWPKNIASRGLGCCGFRSFDYCGRVQNVPEVVNLPENMRDQGIPGGDYPQKHSQIVAKLCPGINWWQDTSKSFELLEACCKSQRPCCVDYNGHDPHYTGGIAHCVTLVACDLENDWVAILDNNYPALDEIVWMSVSAFGKRWGGWSYGLLAETPGAYCAANGNRRADTEYDRTTGPHFGGAEGPFGDGESTIDGEACTIKDIIDRFGGQFAPIKPAIPVNVDHRIDLENLQQPLLAALAAGFVLWVITDKKGVK